MANQRKFFNYRITQLEETFNNANDNIGILEELEEELTIRKTRRARELLEKVKSALNANSELPPPSALEYSTPNTSQSPLDISVPKEPVTNSTRTKSPPQIDDEIDWVSTLNNSPNYFPIEEELSNEKYSDHPLDILESWTSTEAFSPQIFKCPQDLQGNGSVAYLKDGEPWFKGEKSRPKCNLYYIVYLGSIKMDKATENLISIYQDKRIERPSAQIFY